MHKTSLYPTRRYIFLILNVCWFSIVHNVTLIINCSPCIVFLQRFVGKFDSLKKKKRKDKTTASNWIGLLWTFGMTFWPSVIWNLLFLWINFIKMRGDLCLKKKSYKWHTNVEILQNRYYRALNYDRARFLITS